MGRIINGIRNRLTRSGASSSGEATDRDTQRAQHHLDRAIRLIAKYHRRKGSRNYRLHYGNNDLYRAQKHIEKAELFAQKNPGSEVAKRLEGISNDNRKLAVRGFNIYKSVFEHRREPPTDTLQATARGAGTDRKDLTSGPVLQPQTRDRKSKVKSRVPRFPKSLQTERKSPVERIQSLLENPGVPDFEGVLTMKEKARGKLLREVLDTGLLKGRDDHVESIIQEAQATISGVQEVLPDALEQFAAVVLDKAESEGFSNVPQTCSLDTALQIAKLLPSVGDDAADT